MKQQAHKAIISLIQSKEFKDCIGKIKPEYLQDDLSSEVALILLETEPEKIVALEQKNQLKFYTVRIIMNLAYSKNSRFYYKYKKHLSYQVEFKEGIELTECESVNRSKELEETALAMVNDLYWYDAAMLQLYLKVGNYRQMEKESLIPYSSCFITVKKAVGEIKSKIKHKL